MTLRGAARAAALLLGLMLPAVVASQSLGPLAEHFDVVGSVALEESDSVVTVSAMVAMDPEGGFIVADPRDAQVRLYDERGRLRRLVARSGGGPGEVSLPMSAARRSDGHLLVVDVGASSILEFDASGSTEIRRYPTPFPIVRLLASDVGMLAVGTAPPSQPGAPPLLLHVWDNDAVGESFFPLPSTGATRRTAGQYGFPNVTSAGGLFVATYTLSDTVYIYSRDLRLQAAIPVPLKEWSVPNTDPPGAPGSPVRRQWERGMMRISGAYLVDGHLLVQYYAWRDGDTVWGLACLQRDGRVLFDVWDTPRLLAVEGRRLFFIDANSLTDDQWVIASLRR